MTAARHVGRHGVRDATIILLMFRHGLRSAELVALKWSSVDFKNGYLAIHRVKADADASSAAQAKLASRLDDDLPVCAAFAKVRWRSHRDMIAFIPFVLLN